MAFFRNILSNKRVDVDMEAGNPDVELDNMVVGSGSAHSLNANHGSPVPYPFLAPSTVPKAAFPPAQTNRPSIINVHRVHRMATEEATFAWWNKKRKNPR